MELASLASILLDVGFIGTAFLLLMYVIIRSPLQFLFNFNGRLVVGNDVVAPALDINTSPDNMLQ